jgi:hypothetical protein
MQSEQIRKDSEFNRWTLDPIGHRELPAFLEREHENYRRALAELGLAEVATAPIEKDACGTIAIGGFCCNPVGAQQEFFGRTTHAFYAPV